MQEGGRDFEQFNIMRGLAKVPGITVCARVGDNLIALNPALKP